MRCNNQAQHCPQRGSATHTQHVRIGERIPQQRLKTSSRSRQCRANQNAQRDSRQTQPEHNKFELRWNRVPAPLRAVIQRGDNVAQPNRVITHAQRNHHLDEQDRGEPSTNPDDAPGCQRAHVLHSFIICAEALTQISFSVFASRGCVLTAKTCGYKSRASCSIASTNPGEGRDISSFAITRCLCFTACRSRQVGRLRRSVAPFEPALSACAWSPAITMYSGCNRTTSSKLTCGQFCDEVMMDSAPAHRSA